MYDKKLYKYFGMARLDKISDFLNLDNFPFKSIKDANLATVLDILKEKFQHDKEITDFILTPLSRLNDLLTGNIYFSRLEDFNDPFESFFWMEEKLSKNMFNYSSRSTHDRIKIQQEYKGGGGYIRIPFSKKWNSYGVSCFTKKYDNHLMWAHYTNSGSGVCVEYEVHNELISCYDIKGNSRIIIPRFSDQQRNHSVSFVTYGTVEYVRNPIILNEKNLELYENQSKRHIHTKEKLGKKLSKYDLYIMDQIFTKYECWDYENEFRIFVLGVPGLMPLSFFQEKNGNQLIRMKKITLGFQLYSKRENYKLIKLIKNTIQPNRLKLSKLAFKGYATYDLDTI